MVPDAAHTVVLTVLLGGPTLGFLLGFTAMGYGLDGHTFLTDNADAGSGALYATVAILL